MDFKNGNQEGFYGKRHTGSLSWSDNIKIAGPHWQYTTQNKEMWNTSKKVFWKGFLYIFVPCQLFLILNRKLFFMSYIYLFLYCNRCGYPRTWREVPYHLHLVPLRDVPGAPAGASAVRRGVATTRRSLHRAGCATPCMAAWEVCTYAGGLHL